MLKYVYRRDNFDDTVDLPIQTYSVEDKDDDYVLVSLYQDDTNKVKCEKGEDVSVYTANEYENDYDDGDNIIVPEYIKTQIYSYKDENSIIQLLIEKYKEIEIKEILESVSDDEVNYLDFIFENVHQFKQNDDISIRIKYFVGEEDITLTNLEYVNCKTISWRVENDVYNKIKNIIFPLFNSTLYSNNNLSNIKILREQTVFKRDFNHDSEDVPRITIVRSKLKINVPIITNVGYDLLKEVNISEYIVNKERANTIPLVNEMEKVVYSPINPRFENNNYITKINFNLHFREHSGENWTVKPTDDWNFSKYGYDNTNEVYYSYENKSNQSDLLGYLGFTTNDVKYQTNALKKSFLRLSYYDSPNPSNQNLLAYSTIFFNTGDLYSKLCRCQNMDGCFVNEYLPDQTYNSINIHREVLKNKLRIKNLDDEKIEEYRLSSQFSVGDKYTSLFSSEGFYLYLWADNKTNQNNKQNLYMKVEFNHAKYGRVIPFMLPYNIKGVDDNSPSIKNNIEIRNDWNGNGWGIKRVNEYLYIKLKYYYDESNKRYVYHIDDDVYGYDLVKNSTLNINLYEARVGL